MASKYFNTMVDNKIGFVRTNTLVRASLGTLLIFYVGYVVPNLDVKLAKLTGNPWVTLIVLTLIGLTSKHDVGLALLLAAAFIATTNHLFHAGMDSARRGNTDPVTQLAMNPFGPSKVTASPVLAKNAGGKMIPAVVPQTIPLPPPPPVEPVEDTLQPYVSDDTEMLAPFISDSPS